MNNFLFLEKVLKKIISKLYKIILYSITYSILYSIIYSILYSIIYSIPIFLTLGFFGPWDRTLPHGKVGVESQDPENPSWENAPEYLFLIFLKYLVLEILLVYSLVHNSANLFFFYFCLIFLVCARKLANYVFLNSISQLLILSP